MTDSASPAPLAPKCLGTGGQSRSLPTLMRVNGMELGEVGLAGWAHAAVDFLVAYAKGLPENGGGESVETQDLLVATSLARKATRAAITVEAADTTHFEDGRTAYVLGDLHFTHDQMHAAVLAAQSLVNLYRRGESPDWEDLDLVHEALVGQMPPAVLAHVEAQARAANGYTEEDAVADATADDHAGGDSDGGDTDSHQRESRTL